MTIPSDCPFCLVNGKVKILAEEEHSYLVQVLHPETQQPLPGRYFVIPKDHLTDPLDAMWKSWWVAELKDLLDQIPDLEGAAYNLNVNVGKQAGQRVEHVHFWIIIRTEDEAAPSYALGLSTLIDRVNA